MFSEWRALPLAVASGIELLHQLRHTPPIACPPRPHACIVLSTAAGSLRQSHINVVLVQFPFQKSKLATVAINVSKPSARRLAVGERCLARPAPITPFLSKQPPPADGRCHFFTLPNFSTHPSRESTNHFLCYGGNFFVLVINQIFLFFEL